jgi:cell division protein FtsB
MTQIRGWQYILLIFGLAVVAWMVMAFNGRMAQLNRLTREREVVDERYLQIKGTLAALEAEVAYAQSEAAVEKWAYQEGHMIRPGDYPVLPLSNGTVKPTPLPQSAVEQKELSNKESWWALFFGLNSP